MRKSYVPTLIVLMGMLAGCDQLEELTGTYKIEEANNRTYRLNTKTGEVATINNGVVSVLRQVDKSKPSVIKLTKNFDAGIKADFKVKIVDGLAMYSAVVSSAPDFETGDDGNLKEIKTNSEWLYDQLEDKSKKNSLFLNLMDSDGFRIFEREIDLTGRKTRMMGFDGKVDNLEYNGSFDVSPKVEQEFSELSVTYILELDKPNQL